jgi:hypothetical protein
MRSQATCGDQKDHPHPLRRACLDWSNRISQPCKRGEGPYSRSKVGADPMHEEEDYKEVSPEPKDYGGSDYYDDHRQSSWAAAGREDNRGPERPRNGGLSLLAVMSD